MYISSGLSIYYVKLKCVIFSTLLISPSFHSNTIHVCCPMVLLACLLLLLKAIRVVHGPGSGIARAFWGCSKGQEQQQEMYLSWF